MNKQLEEGMDFVRNDTLTARIVEVVADEEFAEGQYLVIQVFSIKVLGEIQLSQQVKEDDY